MSIYNLTPSLTFTGGAAMTSQRRSSSVTESVTSLPMTSEHRDSTTSSVFSFQAAAFGVGGKRCASNGRSTQMESLYPQLVSSKLSLQEIETGKVCGGSKLNHDFFLYAKKNTVGLWHSCQWRSHPSK